MNFFESLQHYFFPRHSNNHKAKVLHASSLIIISALLVGFQFALSYISRSEVKILGYAANISTDEVITLTNQKRLAAGVPALNHNSQLYQAALAKGNHMLANNYWAHIAPDGTEPWKFFTDAGYRYRYAGENLARDFTNPTSAVDAWMASPTHKENLLSQKYVDIGVAVVEGNLNGVDTTIIVQMFGAPLGESQPVLVEAKQATPTPTVVLEEEISSSESALTDISVTPSLSPEPTVVENIGQLDSLPPVQKEASVVQNLISPFQTTKGISVVVTSLLIFVFVVDFLVVARRRIPRSSSRTFAHIAFLGMILAIILLIRIGKIL